MDDILRIIDHEGSILATIPNPIFSEPDANVFVFEFTWPDCPFNDLSDQNYPLKGSFNRNIFQQIWIEELSGGPIDCYVKVKAI